MERLFGNDEVTDRPAVRADAPLATRMRPRTIDEFVGQDRLLAAGSALRRARSNQRIA